MSRKWTESSHKIKEEPTASLLASWLFLYFMTIRRHDARLIDERSEIDKMRVRTALSLSGGASFFRFIRRQPYSEMKRSGIELGMAGEEQGRGDCD
ncbi:MAG: hypothetical protein ACI4E1_01195 [Lachnospira sp.]